MNMCLMCKGTQLEILSEQATSQNNEDIVYRDEWSKCLTCGNEFYTAKQLQESVERESDATMKYLERRHRQEAAHAGPWTRQDDEHDNELRRII